jgi:hypothetical protein
VNGDGFGDVIVGTQPLGAQSSSSVYVYLGGLGGIDTTATEIRAPSLSSEFGQSVASAGDVNGDGFADVVVGAGNGVYVYTGGATGLDPTPTILARPSHVRASARVAGVGDINGDGYGDIVVGAAEVNSAYVYLGSASGPNGRPNTFLTVSANTTTGITVAGAGDVNGDGFADVAIGGAAAAVYLGGASGLGTTPTPLSGGSLVACAGDVNGDGYSDVMVGGSATATVYPGGATGLGARPMALSGRMDGMGAGISIAGAGDIDGDGYADVVLGSPAQGSAPDQLLVYHGGPIGFGAPMVLSAPTGAMGFGSAVSGAGDVNGDGLADVIVGTNSNAVYVYLGAAGMLSAMPVVLEAPSGVLGFGGIFARVESPFGKRALALLRSARSA